jgi:predicted esterase
MRSLALRATWALPDAPASSGGLGKVTHGDQLAWVLAPRAPDPAHAHPLVVVLHGAGRQDEMLVRGLRDESERRRAIFVVPRSRQMTWDLIAGGDGDDLAFLGVVLDSVYRRFRIDPARQGLLGFSDGASYGLGVGLSNPRVFAAVMGWAAGFVAIDAQNLRPDDPKPRVLLEHGTHDQLFPFDDVAVPIRDLLVRLGYAVDFRVDEGGIHWPRPTFARDALDWFLGPSPLDSPSGPA